MEVFLLLTLNKQMPAVETPYLSTAFVVFHESLHDLVPSNETRRRTSYTSRKNRKTKSVILNP